MSAQTAVSPASRLRLHAMRLDLYIVESGLASSRTDAKRFIIAGSVVVNGKEITKPAFEVDPSVHRVTVDSSSKKFVSRGGIKLEYALDSFEIDVADRLALDVGASSGGFTDCLLKRGASHVIAVDSGSGQLAPTLICDERVTSIESFNARYMQPSDFTFTPDIAVMDVSFISAKLIIPAVYSCLAESSDFVCLVKPQFEVGKSGLSKNGIVKDESLRRQALLSVIDFGKAVGFTCMSSVESPIHGGDGNIEYLVHFRKDSHQL